MQYHVVPHTLKSIFMSINAQYLSAIIYYAVKTSILSQLILLCCHSLSVLTPASTHAMGARRGRYSC